MSLSLVVAAPAPASPPPIPAPVGSTEPPPPTPSSFLTGPRLTFEEDGLVIPLMPRGTWWLPVLTPGTRRPICVNITSTGEYTLRVLVPGESWETVEATMRERLAADDPPSGPVPVVPAERAD